MVYSRSSGLHAWTISWADLAVLCLLMFRTVSTSIDFPVRRTESACPILGPFLIGVNSVAMTRTGGRDGGFAI